MKEQSGRILHFAGENRPVAGYTVSEQICHENGTGLSEHAAPGEALVFALDGEDIIGYEGKQYTLHAGATFKFDKFGKHSATAEKPFKMVLLLVLG